MGKLYVFDHPVMQHKLTLLREKHTGAKDFRELVTELSMFMAYEVTRNLPLEEVEIETPIQTMKAKKLQGEKIAIVPVLRAGLGMVDGILKMLPTAKVGHIGLFRDPETKMPVEYYCKLPEEIGEREVVIVDPMLATGGSSNAAIDLLKRHGATKISLMSILAAPEGIEKVRQAHGDVNIYVAAVDERLNDHAYIVPGLGDAGDRLYGTK